MIEYISILFLFFLVRLTCLFEFSAFSQHDNCTGNCGPRNYSSLDCTESLVACSEELVGCSQKKCQPLEVKAPPSKSSNSPHTDACWEHTTFLNCYGSARVCDGYISAVMFCYVSRGPKPYHPF